MAEGIQSPDTFYINGSYKNTTAYEQLVEVLVTDDATILERTVIRRKLRSHLTLLRASMSMALIGHVPILTSMLTALKFTELRR